MLGTITAADFQPLQGKECTFEATSALSVKLTVEQITSRPDCQVPGAGEAREPFGVLLSGQQDEVGFTSATIPDVAPATLHKGIGKVGAYQDWEAFVE